MASMDLSEDAVLEAARGLSPAGRWRLLCELAGDTWAQVEGLISRNEPRIREMARQRGLNWDSLSDDQRQELILTLIRE